MKRTLHLSPDELRRLVREAYMDGFEDGVGVGRENTVFSPNTDNMDAHWSDSVARFNLEDDLKTWKWG